MKILLPWFLCWIPATNFSQTSRHLPNVSNGAYSKHANVFPAIVNPAALASVKKISVAVYGERKYMLDELNNYSIVIAFPTASGNFGLRGNYLGASAFNETGLDLVYGRKMGSKIDLGVSFSYQSMRIQGYGNRSAIAVDAAMLLHFSDKVHGGFHATTPVGRKFGKDADRIPAIYATGIGFDASEKFFVGAEIVKEEQMPVSVQAGLKYRVLPQVSVNAGIASGTAMIWFGIGFKLNVCRLEVTSVYHPVLGLTPGLLLEFEFQRKAQ